MSIPLFLYQLPSPLFHPVRVTVPKRYLALKPTYRPFGMRALDAHRHDFILELPLGTGKTGEQRHFSVTLVNSIARNTCHTSQSAHMPASSI